MGEDFWKNIIFSGLRSRYFVTTSKQIEKSLFCQWKNTSKLWRTWSLALPVHNILSHLYFFKVGEIMLLKYGNLMLPAGHTLDLYYIWLSNAASFCKNYTKLYFDAKHLEKGLNRWGRFTCPFSKKSASFVYSFSFLRRWSM